MKTFLYSLCSLNWADIIISSSIGGVVGLILVIFYDKLKLHEKRKELKKVTGRYKGLQKHNPNKSNSAIDIELMSGTILKVTAVMLHPLKVSERSYTGKIMMNSYFLNSGRGTYIHSSRGQENKWGVIEITIHENGSQIFADISYQKDEQIKSDPEVWKRVYDPIQQRMKLSEFAEALRKENDNAENE